MILKKGIDKLKYLGGAIGSLTIENASQEDVQNYSSIDSNDVLISENLSSTEYLIIIKNSNNSFDASSFSASDFNW